MPIQFPDMMQVRPYEETNPFLGQLTKSLSLGLEMPRQLQQQDLVNALKQVELKYAPEKAKADLMKTQLGNQKEQILMPTLLPAAKTDIAYKNALIDYYKLTATPKEIRILDYLKNHINKKEGATGGAPDLVPGTSLGYSMDISPAVSNVSNTTKQTSKAKEISDSILKKQKEDEQNKRIYFGQQPQIGLFDNNTMEGQYLNSIIPDPNSDFKQRAAQKDFEIKSGLYKGIFETLNKQVDSAIDLNPQLNSLRDLYTQITTSKGRFGGKLPGYWDPAVSEFDKKLQGVINQNAMLLNQGAGGARSYDFTAAAGSKASRDMPEDAFVNLISTLKGGAEQKEDELSFMRNAYSSKIDPELAKEAYGVYKRHRPTMNQGTGQIYKNNAFLGTGKDFLTPQALRAIEEKGDYVPPNQKILSGRNITKKDIEETAKILGTKKINAIMSIEDPGSIPKEKLDDLPINVLLEIRNNKLKQGGQ